MPFCLEPARVKQRTHRQISALDIRTITGGAGPRAERGDMDLLRRSIARLGLISPLLVRARGDGYELIAGARRLSACRALGLSRVECVIMPALDEEFDVALIGKKGVWYDHKVSVSNPVLKEDDGDDAAAIALADGTYTIEVGFEGGSGKSHVLTPCTLKVENGAATATIVWSSEKYDYMLVDGQRFDVLTTEGGSTFEIPVRALDTPLTVIGDTTAMSTPHEIEYTLTFDSSTAVEAAQ